MARHAVMHIRASWAAWQTGRRKSGSAQTHLLLYVGLDDMDFGIKFLTEHCNRELSFAYFYSSEASTSACARFSMYNLLSSSEGSHDRDISLKTREFSYGEYPFHQPVQDNLNET